MKHLISLFVAVALVGSACGQSKIDVTLPSLPSPVPAPVNPGAPTVLTSNMLYVINASAPVMVLASPDGILKVTSDTGPIKIRGQFIDGSGKTETRTFKGPSVYTVEAVGQGTCELIVVSSMDPATVIRRMIVSQIGPVPPPDPIVPVVPVDPLVSSMADALKADGQTASIAANLARVYRAIALSTVNNTAIATYADLFGQVKTLQDSAVVPASIPKLRSVIGQQFTSAFGTSAMAPIDRALAAKTFNAVAAALEGVK